MPHPILVVGSVAFDDLETPHGVRENALGGSANYFSVGASLFAPIRLVAVVGDDFPAAHLDAMRARGVDLGGLDQVTGPTFRWRGRYAAEDADAETLDTRLNVFEHFQPRIPAAWKSTPIAFLGNIHPKLQLDVLDQLDDPQLVGADTMNFWIKGERAALLEVLRRIDLLVINETEARQLAGESNIWLAADAVRAMGPKILVVKRGAYGALLFHPEGIFVVPAVPLREVIDPTGAGDTFAAGVMGSLAMAGATDFATLRRAVLTGTVLASFTCQGFSLDRLLTLDRPAVDARMEELLVMIRA
ncbi:MAG: PfkB family carbohydrate kinase [bacterium]|nr:sugar kinase [Myxococcales bacterium]